MITVDVEASEFLNTATLSFILFTSFLILFLKLNWFYSNPNLIPGVKKIQSVKFTSSYIQNISLEETTTKKNQ